MLTMLLGVALFISSPQSGTAAANASLEGVVREADTRAPIADARVMLTGNGVRETTTADAQGRFTFTGLRPERYTIVAEMEGFAFDLNTPGRALLSAGRTAQLDLEMLRAAIITGEVRDDRGNPRSGIAVTAIRKTSTGGTELTRTVPAATNDLGEFRLDRLLPGEYVVIASPAPGRTPGTAVLPTYYPGVAALTSAASVVVTAGQTVTGIRIALQSAPAFEITGTVVDEQGRPVRALLAFVSQSIQTWDPNRSGGLRAQVTAVATRADGTFRIAGLGPGSYRLTPLPAPDGPPERLPLDTMTAALNGNRSTQQVDVRGGNVSGVTIVMRASR